MVSCSQLDPSGADQGTHSQTETPEGGCLITRSEMVSGGGTEQVPMQHGRAGRGRGGMLGGDQRLPAKGPGVQQWAEGRGQVSPAHPQASFSLLGSLLVGFGAFGIPSLARHGLLAGSLGDSLFPGNREARGSCAGAGP